MANIRFFFVWHVSQKYEFAQISENQSKVRFNYAQLLCADDSVGAAAGVGVFKGVGGVGFGGAVFAGQ